MSTTRISVKDEGRGGGGPPGAILVAEDERPDVMLLKRGLAKAGVEVPVRFVSDGEEVIEYLEGKPPFSDRGSCPLPSVLVLDLKMPRMSGLEVLEWIRRRRELDGLAVVVWTGAEFGADARTAYNLGADFYFVKGSSAEAIAGVAKELKQVTLNGGRRKAGVGLAKLSPDKFPHGSE